jgi:hypothetical protein
MSILFLNKMDFKKLREDFFKERFSKRIILGCAAATFLAMFLPWKFSNGWNDIGIITGLASFLLLLLWIIPRIDIEKINKHNYLEKGIILAMLIGVVVFMIRADFSYLGLGFYVALVATGTASYFAFHHFIEILIKKIKEASQEDDAEKNEKTKDKKKSKK